jgi:hypothetical protein
MCERARLAGYGDGQAQGGGHEEAASTEGDGRVGRKEGTSGDSDDEKMKGPGGLVCSEIFQRTLIRSRELTGRALLINSGEREASKQLLAIINRKIYCDTLLTPAQVAKTARK